MRRILLDCDPGIDDAVALLLARGHPGVELVAVTTVHGNRPLADTTRNALAVLAAAGATGVPVAAGCDRPLAGPHRPGTSRTGSACTGATGSATSTCRRRAAGPTRAMRQTSWPTSSAPRRRAS